MPKFGTSWLEENNFEVKETIKEKWNIDRLTEGFAKSPTYYSRNSQLNSFYFMFDARSFTSYDNTGYPPAYLTFVPNGYEYSSYKYPLVLRVSKFGNMFEESIHYPGLPNTVIVYFDSPYHWRHSLHFDIEIDILGEKPAVQSLKMIDTVDIQGHVLENYQNMLESGDYSDFVLLVGGKEFRVHKNILAAQSEVFAAMFNADLDEKKTNRAEIGDMEVDVCQQMLNYIYGGKVDKLGDMAVELMAAADKYQLKHLKCICERSLSLSLSTESVVKSLVMADMHQATELKSECIKFIGANSAAVKSTESWKMMIARPDLLMGLFDKLSIK